MIWKSELTSGLNRFWGGLDFSSDSRPITGWGLVGWGASQEDMARIYTGSVDNEGSLVVSGQDYQKRQYSISFGFNSSRQLNSVTLSFAGGQELADFKPISERIIARFGGPDQVTTTSATWTSGDNEFNLSKSPGGGLVLSSIV